MKAAFIVLLTGFLTLSVSESLQAARKFHYSLAFINTGFDEGEYEDYAPERIEQTGIIPDTSEISIHLNFSYDLTNNIGLHASVPFGGLWSAAEELNWQPPSKLVLGDIGWGTSLFLKTKRENGPILRLNWEKGLPTAKEPASGGYFQRHFYGAELRQPVSRNLELFANGSYIQRLEKESIKPSPIRAYGGGINYYTFSEESVSIWTVGYQDARSERSQLPIDVRPSPLTNSFESSQLILGYTFVSLDQRKEVSYRLSLGISATLHSKIGEVEPVKKVCSWVEIGN